MERAEKKKSAGFVLGLDLGQSADYTALAIVERVEVEFEGASEYRYALRQMKRWPLGTPYPEIVENVREIVKRPPLNCPVLAVDQTGVGRPVVDLFRTDDIDAQLRPILITSGHAITMGGDGSWHVPKKELVAALAVVMQTRRIRFANFPERATLIDELKHFKVKITAAKNEVYECLVAGTMVETAVGPVPIEQVKAGDMVLTRGGHRRVRWAGETKRVVELTAVRFDSGVQMVGTADHLVWTMNRGWVSLSHLTTSDECLGASCQSHSTPVPTTSEKASTPRSSYSTASSIVGLPVTPTTFRQGNTGRNFTGPSGSTTTAQSQKAVTSTTRMKTPTTTTSPIWSASPAANTPGSIIRKTLSWFGHALRAAGRFVVRTSGASSALRNAPTGGDGCESSTASNAATCSAPTDMEGTGRLSGSVRPSAEKRTDTSIGRDRCDCATGAAMSSGPCTRYPSSVQAVALPNIVRVSKPVPVYDLVVEGDHEFFANGILVHNSWRERDHDDQVLALGLSIWLAERNAGLSGEGHVFGSDREQHWSQRACRTSRAEQSGLFGMRNTGRDRRRR